MLHRRAAVLLAAGLMASVLGACGEDTVAEPALTNPGSAPATSASAPTTEAGAPSTTLGAPAATGDGCADVIDGTIEVDNGVADVTATVRSADTGWDKYADRWEVRTEDGTVLGERILTHPHENEQPFTRSLGGVPIPADVTAIVIAAHDSVAGFCGETFAVEIGDGS